MANTDLLIPAISAAPWSAPQWLASWRAELPPPASRQEIATALTSAEDALMPVDQKIAAALIAQTMGIWGVPPNWAEIAGFYLEVLEDVPPDLASLAMKHCRRNCRFMPRPADIRDQIAEELAERRVALSRLRHALWRAEHAACG
jgi:hypothetical protein